MDTLVAAAIHDAKNALSSLGVWLDEAQRECDPQHKSAAMLQAKTITATLNSQLVELLAMYRAGEGNLRLAVEDQHLGDFLAELMAELAAARPMDNTGHAATASAITIDTDFAFAEQNAAWAFDAYLVKFVLLDALRNALRHARQRIHFSIAAEPGGGIRFSVADDGEGYPPETLRNETSSTMSKKSSGLGLSFAHLIAARHATPSGHHGRLELANDGINGGARVSLVLP